MAGMIWQQMVEAYAHVYVYIYMYYICLFKFKYNLFILQYFA